MAWTRSHLDIYLLALGCLHVRSFRSFVLPVRCRATNEGEGESGGDEKEWRVKSEDGERE